MIHYAIQSVLFAVSALLLICGLGAQQAGVEEGNPTQTAIGYAIVGVGVVFALFAIFWPGKNRRNSNYRRPTGTPAAVRVY
jgi:hypothetical protein